MTYTFEYDGEVITSHQPFVYVEPAPEHDEAFASIVAEEDARYQAEQDAYAMHRENCPQCGFNGYGGDCFWGIDDPDDDPGRFG